MKAYRDPAAASARLREMMRASGSAEAVVAALRKQGPALLGKLRGSKGLFASAQASAERAGAEVWALSVPGAVMQRAWLRTDLKRDYRNQLESDRHRERIEVPGLSAEALAAIAPLQRSDFLQRTLQDVPVKLLTADKIASAASVASVWSAIQADKPVRAELARFRQAVDERLGGRPYTGSDPAAAVRVSKLVKVLAQAERLTARHAAVPAAREAEQREAERRERVAEQNRAQAEIERMLRRPRARPRPSSGPGMG